MVSIKEIRLPGLAGKGVLKVSKNLDLKNYIPTLDNTPGFIKAVEIYFDILKDLYKKDEIGPAMFFVLLSTYVNGWKEKAITLEADRIKKILNQ